jgi:hypothetical protein
MTDLDGRSLRPTRSGNMAAVIVALCAEEAQNITGQVFHIWGAR